MPYSYPSNIPRVAKHWSDAEKRICSNVANDALNAGKSERDSIFACIGAVKNHRKKYKTYYKQEPKQNKFDQESEKASKRFQHLVELFFAGEITLEEFTGKFQTELKDTYTKIMLLGRNGKDITETDLAELQRRLDKQYSYLDGFVKDLGTGRYSQQRSMWRAGLYGIPYAAFVYYSTPEDVASLMPDLPGDLCLGGPSLCGCALDVSYDDEGNAHVDWVLDPMKEHCVVCLERASETWTFSAEELLSVGKK